MAVIDNAVFSEIINIAFIHLLQSMANTSNLRSYYTNVIIFNPVFVALLTVIQKDSEG